MLSLLKYSTVLVNLGLRNELLSWPVALPRCGVRGHSLVIKILLIFATSNPSSILVRMIPFIYGAMIAEVL